MKTTERLLVTAGRPAGAVAERVNDYHEGDLVRVIDPHAQYYTKTGRILLVGGYDIFVAIEGDAVAYYPAEIRRVK